jgi:GDPmannose 4,6-dehydratase
MRPTEVAALRGDATKAHCGLGWRPKTSFDELIHEMLENDLTLEGLDPGRQLRMPVSAAR